MRHGRDASSDPPPGMRHGMSRPYASRVILGPQNFSRPAFQSSIKSVKRLVIDAQGVV